MTSAAATLLRESTLDVRTRELITQAVALNAGAALVYAARASAALTGQSR